MESPGAARRDRNRAFHHLGDAQAIHVLHREDLHLRGAHDLFFDLVQVANADEHRVFGQHGG